MPKLTRAFYQQSALTLAPQFLGKYLVHQTPEGKISGMIVETEAYGYGIDEVNHARTRTPRTEVLFQPGGFAYVYLIYGLYHQLSVVVNARDIPEVVFIRAIIPEEGLELMQQNFGKSSKTPLEMTKTPGNLCKALGITLNHYATDLTGETLYLEDRAVEINPEHITQSPRIGINTKLQGHDNPFRFVLTSHSKLDRTP